jgi:hypothetical protein
MKYIINFTFSISPELFNRESKTGFESQYTGSIGGDKADLFDIDLTEKKPGTYNATAVLSCNMGYIEDIKRKGELKDELSNIVQEVLQHDMENLYRTWPDVKLNKVSILR